MRIVAVVGILIKIQHERSLCELKSIIPDNKTDPRDDKAIGGGHGERVLERPPALGTAVVIDRAGVAEHQ